MPQGESWTDFGFLTVQQTRSEDSCLKMDLCCWTTLIVNFSLKTSLEMNYRSALKWQHRPAVVLPLGSGMQFFKSIVFHIKIGLACVFKTPWSFLRIFIDLYISVKVYKLKKWQIFNRHQTLTKYCAVTVCTKDSTKIIWKYLL